jgi:hypothetical protein
MYAAISKLASRQAIPGGACFENRLSWIVPGVVHLARLEDLLAQQYSRIGFAGHARD